MNDKQKILILGIGILILTQNNKKTQIENLNQFRFMMKYQIVISNKRIYV